MKTFIQLIFTCLVSTFGFFGALSMKDNPWPGFAVAFGVWGIFLWRYNVRLKRAGMKKRFDEHQFREYVRFKQQYNRRSF